ncbi:hypothetical protein WA026_004934 [Henosepilachna vigintioctopunctata]|uniref:Ubiquitin carboxyl-terminal hydrolase n=1 Tax=Henosepilachna vigintioctopunctata TaxID=420089 RepID=A0AAW1ULP3_9CUCU
MSYNYFCNHLNNVNIPSVNVTNSKVQYKCSDCNYSGPKLWICLHQNCLRLGCSDELNHHSSLHFTAYPKHSVYMNVVSRSIFCYSCNTEVIMEAMADCGCNEENLKVYPEVGNQEVCSSNNSVSINSAKDGQYFFEKNVGLNVGSGGDPSDYTDSDDSDDMVFQKPSGLVGLQNLGNTCYMNAALQALSNAQPLTRFFLDCSSTVQMILDDKKPGLCNKYQTLIREIWTQQNGGYVSASGVLYSIRMVHPMFRGFHQHDTQEFLRNFMDQLHEELKQQSFADSIQLASAVDEATVSSSHESSEGEYETCDSGVSERSSLSDDTENSSGNFKRRLVRSASPGRRLRARMHNSGPIDYQPASATCPNNIRKHVKYRSIISDIFDGKILSSVQCLTCNRISSRVETFQDVSLPIPSKEHLMLLHERSVPPDSTFPESVISVQDGWILWIFNWLKSWFYGPTVTLHDCLAAFFSTDELKGDNMYSCERCSKLRNGIKFSKVLQLPEILCIHLKRFRHELMFSSKISSPVSFPLKGLEMKPYLHENCISKVTTYELFSVICHHGTAGAGHYISYALNSGKWYEFDDTCVTEVTAEKVENCEAYVLFYRKSTAAADKIKAKVINMSEKCDDVEIAYVSKQWINRFNTCAEPGPIDNSDFLCQHRSINPDKVSNLNQLSVIVPLPVYEYLQKLFGGSPPITYVHVCSCCQALNKRRLFEMETFRQLTTETLNRNMPATHSLSVAWYTQWHNFVNKKNLEPPEPIDNSKININQIDMNDCVNISKEIWNFFYNIYGGGPEILLVENESKMSDNENVEDEDVNETDKRFVVSNSKYPENAELDSSNYCHGEPMSLGEGSQKDEANEDNSHLSDCCSKVEGYISNEIHSTVFTSRSPSTCSADNSSFGCKNNDVKESLDSHKEKLKL